MSSEHLTWKLTSERSDLWPWCHNIAVYCFRAHFLYTTPLLICSFYLLINTFLLFFSHTYKSRYFGECQWGIWGLWYSKVEGQIGRQGCRWSICKSRQHSPHLVDTHCLPRQLELALVEVQKRCHQFEVVYDVLQLIWKTYHYSPKCTRVESPWKWAWSIETNPGQWNQVAPPHYPCVECLDQTSWRWLWSIPCCIVSHGPSQSCLKEHWH